MRHLSSCRVGVGECGWRGVYCVYCVCVCPYRSVVKNVFVVPKVRWAPFASSSSTSVFFPLVLFFLTPLSLCVALYHGAGLGPCSLDPFCLLASWLTPPIPPPRSDAASRGTAQRQGLQKALKPGEPELLLPQFRTGGLGGEVGMCLANSAPANGCG